MFFYLLSGYEDTRPQSLRSLHILCQFPYLEINFIYFEKIGIFRSVFAYFCDIVDFN